MKLSLLKIALPVLVTGFAAAAAMNTKQSTVESTVANERGFIRHSSVTNCSVSDFCNASGTDMCTVGNVPSGARLWKKNANQECIVPLYKPLPQ